MAVTNRFASWTLRRRLLQALEEPLRRTRRPRIVAIRPEDHLPQNADEVRALRRQPVLVSDGTALVGRLPQEPAVLEPPQAIGQHVGGNALGRREKVRELVLPQEHQVSDDEEGPAVADQVQGVCDRADRAPGMRGPGLVSGWHRREVYIVT